MALPKAHLHLHLVGAMRPSMLADLAAEAGVEVPEVSIEGGLAGAGVRFYLVDVASKAELATHVVEMKPCPTPGG